MILFTNHVGLSNSTSSAGNLQFWSVRGGISLCRDRDWLVIGTNSCESRGNASHFLLGNRVHFVITAGSNELIECQ